MNKDAPELYNLRVQNSKTMFEPLKKADKLRFIEAFDIDLSMLESQSLIQGLLNKNRDNNWMILTNPSNTVYSSRA